jgi:tetratricopeptide (TPR) repeat protein
MNARRLRAVVCVLLIAMMTAACSSGSSSSVPERKASAPAMQPVALPDLAAAEAGVRSQLQESYAALQKAMATHASDADLANAYGSFAMLLHAAEYLDAALPAYLDAAALQPSDVRWPYYLGLLYKTKGQSDEAVSAFQRALAIAPDDLTTMIRLAQLEIDQGRLDDADRLLTTARARDPRSVPVLAALGQVALARHQYDAAVKSFEAALSIDPGALSLHAPLANAYRGLGKANVAEAHMKQWRNTELPVHDPRQEQLQAQLQSGLSFELRGLAAMRAEDWKGAAAAFREGLKVAPEGSVASRSLHHKLGTSLYMAGDPSGAVREFREVLRSAPPDRPDESAAKANYSIGVLMMSGGRFADAITYLTDAVKSQPNYAEAHQVLADALRRVGRFEPAAEHYREVMRIDPSSADARFGYAVALVRLGRYREARDSLAESLTVLHDQPMLTLALARILATAPDASVRDGRRALALAQQLAQTVKTTDVGETLAMAFAEVGDYSSAIGVQKDVMAVAARAGQRETVAIMEPNLRLYERQQPCRTPWAPGDPINQPGPAVTPELARVAKEVALQH